MLDKIFKITFKNMKNHLKEFLKLLGEFSINYFFYYISYQKQYQNTFLIYIQKSNAMFGFSKF